MRVATNGCGNEVHLFGKKIYFEWNNPVLDIETLGEELDKTAYVEETGTNKDATSSQETSINVKDIVNYEIANFKLPYNVSESDLNFFLDKTSKNTSYEHMYM